MVLLNRFFKGIFPFWARQLFTLFSIPIHSFVYRASVKKSLKSMISHLVITK